MKLFQIGSPGTRVELYTPENDKIVLGEDGRGRSLEVIPVAHIGESDEFGIKKVDGGIVLVKGIPAKEGETRCIVDVNCVGSYDRSRSYDLHNAKNVQIIATGHFAFGDAGSVNGGPNHLIIAHVGAEFMIKSKYASHWYRWDGQEWRMLSDAERDAEKAIEQFHAGEGEWL